MIYEIKDTDITNSKVWIFCPCCEEYMEVDLSKSLGVITALDVGYMVKVVKGQAVVESHVEHLNRTKVSMFIS